MAKKKLERAPKKAEVLAKQRADIDVKTLEMLQLATAWGWHYGNVVGLGFFSTAGGREVVIQWDEGGSSRKQGGVSDEQWEVFKLAFEGTGRIAILSDKADTQWKFDYRFLEAQR